MDLWKHQQIILTKLNAFLFVHWNDFDYIYIILYVYEGGFEIWHNKFVTTNKELDDMFAIHETEDTIDNASIETGNSVPYIHGMDILINKTTYFKNNNVDWNEANEEENDANRFFVPINKKYTKAYDEKGNWERDGFILQHTTNHVNNTEKEENIFVDDLDPNPKDEHSSNRSNQEDYKIKIKDNEHNNQHAQIEGTFQSS